jgi:predicted transcriptional regulator
METARTTIELDKDLIKKAKQKAIAEDKSLKQLISEAVEKIVETPRKVKIEKRIKIRTYDMGPIKGTLRREEIYDWL